MENDEVVTIDLLRLATALWKKKWIIAASAILAALVCMFVSAVLLTPKYSASVLLYINNSSQTGETAKISTSDLSASQSLVKNYIAILNNRATLDKVIEKYHLGHTAGQLLGMIRAETVTGTQIMKVTVTSTDAAEAALIANAVSDILVERVQEIIDGSSMRIVDNAVASNNKVFPNNTKNTLLGLLIGLFVSCAVVIVLELMDNVVHSEDDIVGKYDLPLLASVPDLSVNGSRKYGYGAYSYYGRKEPADKNTAEPPAEG